MTREHGRRLAPWLARSAPTLPPAAFVAGIALAGAASSGGLLPAAVVGLGALAVLRGARLRRPAAALAALLCVCGAAGCAWGGYRAARIQTAPVTATRAVSATVVVDRPPVAGPHGRRRAVVVVERIDGRSASGRLLADVPGAEGRALGGGERLVVRGVLGPAVGPRSPEWWGAHLRRQGIGGRLRVETMRPAGRRGGVAGVRDRWRAWVRSRAGAGTEGDPRALLRGITIGAVDELSEPTADDLRRSGLWHLVAVSGQNVAIVGLSVLWLAGRCGVRRRTAVLAATAAIVAYCVACDGGASVARAGVMGAAGMVALLRGTGRAPWHALVLALAGLAAWNPAALGDPGLQLSFAAVAGLMGVGPVLSWYLRGFVPGFVADACAVSLAAGLATAPVVAWHFESLPLAGVLVNLVAVPLAAPVLVLGLGGLLLGALAEPPGVFLDRLAALGAEALIVTARVGSALPGAGSSTPRAAVLPLAALAVAPVVVDRWLRRTPSPRAAPPGGRGARLAVAAVVAAPLVGLLWPRQAPVPWPAVPTITVLDVGEGDAILLREPGGRAALVDTGPSGDPAPVATALARQGVKRLDVVLLSHGQADHAGAASGLLGDVPVGSLVVPPLPDRAPAVERALAEAGRRGVRVERPLSGAAISLGEWDLELVSPRTVPRPGTDPNVAAAVLVASAAGRRALLTADAESAVVAPLHVGPVDLLKVAHHGSADDLLAPLLASLRPALAVVSVGPNPYGHPDDATLAALGDAAVRVERTDRSGDVSVAFAPDGLTVSTQR